MSQQDGWDARLATEEHPFVCRSPLGPIVSDVFQSTSTGAPGAESNMTDTLLLEAQANLQMEMAQVHGSLEGVSNFESDIRYTGVGEVGGVVGVVRW